MIQISEGAARKIRTLMAKQGIDEGGLRVGVKGGGCSGLSYTFAWEREPRFGDEVFPRADDPTGETAEQVGEGPLLRVPVGECDRHRRTEPSYRRGCPASTSAGSPNGIAAAICTPT